jgi:trimethylamine--corrinoid protein Co-methyltransferase
MGGPGHYLGHAQTLSVMQTEYIYPRLGDRTSPKEWVEIGKPDLVQKAIEMKRKILDAPRRSIIDPLADIEIRKRFKIHVPA